MDIRWKDNEKEYKRLYYLKNKEKYKEQNRLRRLSQNKEQVSEYHRLWRIENKEKLNQYKIDNKEHNKIKQQEYYKTERGIKIKKINHWIAQGILCFDWDLLYDLFLKTTNCEFCNVELTTGIPMSSTTKCLDHNHDINDRFNIRGVLCHSCNNKDVFKKLINTI